MLKECQQLLSRTTMGATGSNWHRRVHNEKEVGCSLSAGQGSCSPFEGWRTTKT
jgi:hypothetical protein